MLKKLLTATLFFFLTVPATGALAQTGTITGVVTDSTTGDPIPGVSILVAGTQIGTSTDANGEYDLTGVPAGQQTLEATFVGYRDERVSVDVQPNATTTRDIQIAEAAVELEDVVVTALGVEREERSLGYSVSQIEGETVDRTGETNFIDNLSGKIAGANVNSSSGLGGSSRIVLRGVSSITGENEPLIVIDGVPLDNSNLNSSGQQAGFGGYDFGNAASMINPASVQSISVLKGPSAAALYGSRAANGVIEITTKSGASQEGIGVTVQSGVTFSDLYNFPDYQNKYGGGAFGPFTMNDQGQLVPDYGTDQSWGPPLDGRMVREWFSYDDVNGALGQTTPWDAHPNNVQNFFEQGRTWKTDIAFAQGGDNYNYRASLNNVASSGVSPGSGHNRRTVSFNGSLDLTDRLSTTLSANYVDENRERALGAGYSNAAGPWVQFNHFGQRQIDLSENAPMQDLRRPNGQQRSWNWKNSTDAPLSGDIIYANNPYWTTRENFPTANTNRVYGDFRITYDLMSNLTLSGNVGTDYYTTRQQTRVAVGSVQQSEYTENLYEVGETNAGAELTYDADLTEDFSLQALGGATYRYSHQSNNLGSTEGGLSTPGVYTLENSTARPDITDYFEEEGLFGIYADATIGYRDLVYLGGSVRNDWSSTLPEENNSYFYPSVRSSFVFSSLPALQDQDVLSYGKLRVSWARVGRDTDPYRLAFTYPGNTPFDGIPLQSLPNTLPNTTLEPEIKTGWEVGAQLQFFNNRLGLDATYYLDDTENQILPVGRSAASGFTEQVLNAGVVRNEGLELQLNLTPVLTDAFRWDFTANWAINENEVTELPEGRVTVPSGTPPFGPDVVAQEGEPLGAFFGNGFARTENGEKILRPGGGGYQLDSGKILGSYQPDWTGGLRTTLSYEGFSVSALVDGQMGGQMWSLSNLFGLYSGMFAESAQGDVREVGLVPEGVVNVGTEENPDYQDLSGEVEAISFYQSLFGNHEAHLYDATHMKLAEATIGYTLPQRWVSQIPSLRSLTVSLVGRDLATLYKETPNFDPSAVTLSSGNAQGFEVGQLPPTRSYGFRVRLSL